MSDIYQRLMATPEREDSFDRHVFACVIAKGWAEAPRPLTEAVGLAAEQLCRLQQRYFPGADWLGAGLAVSTGEDALEEPDLRRLLTDNATRPGDEAAAWLAAMVARRSLQADHLWQDLGLAARSDLSGLLLRHFAPLAMRNDRDMKWKKFFYRQMCEDEGVRICKSPVCDTCTDFTLCYGPEE
ncbi:MAG: nitrogen fixation protein NifQ [Bacteroidota bacterium]